MLLHISMISNDLLNPIYNLKIILTCIIVVLVFTLFKFFNSNSTKNVYLVSYACFQPKKCQQLTREGTIQRTMQYVQKTNFTEETIEILRKMTMASGISDETYIPETLTRDPPDFSLTGARDEVGTIIFGVVDKLLKVTKVKVEEIGILVVNSSVFNPIPSLCSVIINRYKLRDDIKSYCLSGMGCSASLISVDLAVKTLQVCPNTHAMVVSTDVMGHNYYKGNNTDMLKVNCVMRVGGAAILLSNRSEDRPLSKYQFLYSTRTNTSSLDASFRCCVHEEDTEGEVGVTMTKDLVMAVATTIRAHLSAIGPHVLPLAERLKFITNYFARKTVKRLGLPNIKAYTPNFGQGVEQFVPHVGFKPVLDSMENNLRVDVEAARMALYRYGNISSSAIWYVLAYVEAKGKMKRGQRVWQMSFGSGVKCNSIIWRVLNDVEGHEQHNPWSQEIAKCPI